MGDHHSTSLRPARWTWVVLPLVLVACATNPSAVSVTMDEFSFSPPNITVTAGESVQIRLRNDGDVAHDWTLLTRSVTSEAEVTDDIVLDHVLVLPGRSAGVELEGIEPGTYQFVCSIPGHLTQGMVGTLRVEPRP